MESADRHVGEDFVNGYRVSTVFLGLDHGFDSDIQLFETMVFPEDSYAEVYCARYATWEEAEDGHRNAVDMVKRSEILSEGV
jgi:hypothetical protein